jgi:hypothetical protein
MITVGSRFYAKCFKAGNIVQWDNGPLIRLEQYHTSGMYAGQWDIKYVGRWEFSRMSGTDYVTLVKV